MEEQKRACLIYVSATESARAAAKAQLELEGYVVCEVKAKLEDAVAAQTGSPHISTALADCIAASDLCVFLIPEDETSDEGLGSAGEYANLLGKRVIGIVAGARQDFPESIDDQAHAMIREDSDRLKDAICGTEIWEAPDKSPIVDRSIPHIRCQ